MNQVLELLKSEIQNLEIYIARSENSGVHYPSQSEYNYQDQLYKAIDVLKYKSFKD